MTEKESPTSWVTAERISAILPAVGASITFVGAVYSLNTANRFYNRFGVNARDVGISTELLVIGGGLALGTFLAAAAAGGIFWYFFRRDDDADVSSWFGVIIPGLLVVVAVMLGSTSVVSPLPVGAALGVSFAFGFTDPSRSRGCLVQVASFVVLLLATFTLGRLMDSGTNSAIQAVVEGRPATIFPGPGVGIKVNTYRVTSSLHDELDGGCFSLLGVDNGTVYLVDPRRSNQSTNIVDYQGEDTTIVASMSELTLRRVPHC